MFSASWLPVSSSASVISCERLHVRGDLVGAAGQRLGDVEGALRHLLGHGIEPRGKHLREPHGQVFDLLADVVGLDVQARRHLVAGGFQRAADVVAGAVEVVEQVAAALADGVDHRIAGAPERQRDVLALLGERAGDPLRRVVDAGRDHLADRGDVLGQAEVHAGERVADLLGLADQGVALVGEVLDQAADAQLVVVIGALELGDLVVHQRLELGGAGERALDAVAHGGDLAADRLADRDHGLARDRLRLGEPHRHVGHRAGDEAQLLRPAHHVGEHEEEGDRHDDRAENPKQLRRRRALADQVGEVGAEIADGKRDAEPAPHQREQGRAEIGIDRRPLQRLQHLSDRLAIVIGGAARLFDARLLRRERGAVEEQILIDGGAPAPVLARRLGLERARGGSAGRRRRLAFAQIESVLDRRQSCLGRVLHLLWGVGHV